MNDRRRRIVGAFQTAGILLLFLALASIPLTIGLNTWSDHRSMKAEWAIAGPACPVVPEISLAAQGAKPPPPFIYQDVGFAYQIGDVYCEAVPEGYFSKATHPVCQSDARRRSASRWAGAPPSSSRALATGPR